MHVGIFYGRAIALADWGISGQKRSPDQSLNLEENCRYLGIYRLASVTEQSEKYESAESNKKRCSTARWPSGSRVALTQYRPPYFCV